MHSLGKMQKQITFHSTKLATYSININEGGVPSGHAGWGKKYQPPGSGSSLDSLDHEFVSELDQQSLKRISIHFIFF